jgi:hypothetical protein
VSIMGQPTRSSHDTHPIRSSVGHPSARLTSRRPDVDLSRSTRLECFGANRPPTPTATPPGRFHRARSRLTKLALASRTALACRRISRKQRRGYVHCLQEDQGAASGRTSGAGTPRRSTRTTLPASSRWPTGGSFAAMLAASPRHQCRQCTAGNLVARIGLLGTGAG